MFKKLFALSFLLSISLVGLAQTQKPLSKEDSLLKVYRKIADTGDAIELKKVDTEIARLLKSSEEKDFTFAVRVAYSIKQSSLADSINKLAVQKFPTGKAALNAAYNLVIQAPQEIKAKLDAYETFLKKFPEPAEKSDIVYDYARSEIASTYAKAGDAVNNALWLSKIKTQSYKGIAQASNSQMFLQKGDFATAEKLAFEGLQNSKASLENNPNPNAKGDYYYYLQNYAGLLYKIKKYDEALKYINELRSNLEGNKVNQTNEIYALILTGTGKGKEALPMLAELVKTGKGSNEVAAAIKEAYIQTNGKSDGFEKYLSSLHTDMKKSIQAKLAKELISQPAPAFSLVDLEGNKVSLAELKGKVVILDFWATWCGPCKKSFPAMQKALDKYKADPNVRFLFIDTWERIPEPKKAVQAFITENKYTFSVLLDDKNTKVVDKFGIVGIPTKFIIDGKGNIRYKLIGFEGSDEAAVEEISYMIESVRL